jgi:valyl-tRNA synthetase
MPFLTETLFAHLPRRPGAAANAVDSIAVAEYPYHDYVGWQCERSEAEMEILNSVSSLFRFKLAETV